MWAMKWIVVASLLWASLASAEQSLDIKLKAGDSEGRVILTIGNLKGQALPSSAIGTIGFLTRWSKGKLSAEEKELLLSGIRLGQVKLRLPVSGLVVEDETGNAAHVRVSACTLLGSPKTACPLLLELTRLEETDSWRITAIQ